MKAYTWSSSRQGCPGSHRTREVLAADSRADVLRILSETSSPNPVEFDVQEARTAEERAVALASPGIILWRPLMAEANTPWWGTNGARVQWMGGAAVSVAFGEVPPRPFRVMVREFRLAMGLSVREVPTMPDEAERLLLSKLLLEEALEFVQANGCRVAVDSGGGLSVQVDHTRAPSLTAMAAELADVQYISSSVALALGVEEGEVLAEVHAANMRKLGPDGRPVLREDGKVVKPAGWRPPDVESVLARQAKRGGQS